MPLNIQKTRVHDHTDGDLILINKTKLAHHLHINHQFANSLSAALGWLGIAVALAIAAVVTEKFRNVGPISGDTIRALFLMLAAVFGLFAIKTGWHWYKHKDKYQPEDFVENLMTSNPLSLSEILLKPEVAKKQGIHKKDNISEA
jgi:predicted membrane channel-forming protein YqfA (hemolysin III family)